MQPRSARQPLIPTTWRKLEYLEQGDHAAAEPLYREALAAFREIHELWWTGRCMQFLALVSYGRGDPQRSACLLGGSDAVLESGGARRIPSEESQHAELSRRLRIALGEAAFEVASAEGRAMTLAQAVADALDGQPSA